MTTNIIIDSNHFLKFWKHIGDADNKIRYMDYFIFYEFNLDATLHVYIYCPFFGDCNQFVHEWEKLIFNNLRIHW